VRPGERATSRRRNGAAKATMAMLKRLRSAELAKAYGDNEATYKQQFGLLIGRVLR